MIVVACHGCRDAGNWTLTQPGGLGRVPNPHTGALRIPPDPGRLFPPRAPRCQVARTKQILSANTEAPISVEELWQDRDFRSTISRQKFEELAGEGLPGFPEAGSGMGGDEL